MDLRGRRVSGYSASSRLGRIPAAGTEVDTVWTPRTPRVGKCGVVLLHGQSSPKQYMDSAQIASVRLAAALAGSGIPCIAAEMRGNSWANANGMADLELAGSKLQAEFPAIRTDKVCLVGISMGAALAARYSQLHPAAVAAVVGVIPAYDPKAIYINNDAGDAAMEAAWGFSGLVNFPDALDLGPKAALASSVPILSGYASDDTLVPAASVTAYHAAAGGIVGNLLNVGNLGHTDAAIAAVPIATIARFLGANGA